MNRLADVASAVVIPWSLALALGLVCEQVSTVIARFTTAFRFFAFVYQELWIVAPPGILILAADNWHDHDYLGVAIYVLSLYNWWTFRNWPDENRWTRRGRKLKDAIVVRAGRLVVQPA
jgi:hypothetical protein